MLRILGLGDNVVDKYMYIRAICSGGDALNFAVYAKIFGAEADYLGVFRDDEAAVHIYDTTRSLGLEFSHCRFYPGESRYTKVRLDNEDRVFIGSNKDGVSREHPLELTVTGRVYIASCDIVHTSIFSYIESELSLLRQALSFVSMDFSDRTDGGYLRQCVPYADCASTSYDDVPRSEIGKQITPTRKFGCRHIVIVTRGTKGALVTVDERLYEQLPCLVEAMDTMGAGDSFITRFLMNYVGAMEDSKGFLAVSETKGTVTAAGYQDLAVRASLYRAAAYSAGSCQKDGSFGFRKVFQNE